MVYIKLVIETLKICIHVEEIKLNCRKSSRNNLPFMTSDKVLQLVNFLMVYRKLVIETLKICIHVEEIKLNCRKSSRNNLPFMTSDKVFRTCTFSCYVWISTNLHKKFQALLNYKFKAFLWQVWESCSIFDFVNFGIKPKQIKVLQ